MAHRLPNGDVIGVATAVVPAVGRPELAAELCAAMESVPVDAHDVGWWIGRERVGRVSCWMASSCLGGLPPRMWT